MRAGIAVTVAACLAMAVGCGSPTSPLVGGDSGIDVAQGSGLFDGGLFDGGLLDGGLLDSGLLDGSSTMADASIDAAPGVAMLTVATPDLVFAADIGERVSQMVEIVNTGTANAYVQVAVTGDRQIQAPLTGCVAQPMQSCYVYVQFLAYKTGTFTATVTLSSTSNGWSDELTAKGETYTALRVGTWGEGTVTGPGINCSDYCKARYTGSITLTAAATPGHRFVAWNDTTCGTQSTCTLPPEAIGRGIYAYFAPESTTNLNISITGSGRGLVYVSSSSPGQSGAMIAACRVSCQIPVPTDAVIDVHADAISNTPILSGACSGLRTCSFTASKTKSLTVSLQTDPKELYTRALGTGPLIASAYDSEGNLLVLASAQDSALAQVIKLDPQGKTIWAMPSMIGTEIYAGVGDRVIVRISDVLWVYDKDGYRIGADSFSGVNPFNYSDPPHFVHRMFETSTGLSGLVGSANAMTNIRTTSWSKTFAGTSMQTMRATASNVYVGVGNASGGFDVEVISSAGLVGTPIADAAPYAGTFDLLPQGGIATASATTSAVALRRLAGGATTFTRSVPIAYDKVPFVGVAPTSSDRIFWLYSAQSPIAGFAAGYTAEVVDSTGNVTWTVTRSDPTYWRGPEVYDLASNGTDVTIVGGYSSVDGVVVAPQALAQGEGFIQVFRP